MDFCQQCLVRRDPLGTRFTNQGIEGRQFIPGKDDRPGLVACLKALQPGNTLAVWKLDRLGRDLKHLVTTVDDLRARNVGLKVLAGAGAQIDTTTANGRLFLGIFAALADDAERAIMQSHSAEVAMCLHVGDVGVRINPGLTVKRSTRPAP
jgi:DNA invertase Pin-like site-specific DNA recombinase